MVRLAVETGLRSGKVRGLRWPDVDLAARPLTSALAEALAALYAAEVVGRGADASGYVAYGSRRQLSHQR
jgi:integrase